MTDETTDPIIYECKYCGKQYKYFRYFEQHSCREKTRLLIHGTIEGQIAYSLYERWLKLRHGATADPNIFMVSRYYIPLLRFAKYYKNIKGLPNLDDFLLLMIKLDILPNCWYSEKILSYYFTELEKSSPNIKIKNSYETIVKYCNINDIDTSAFFDILEFDELVSMIKLSKISPWILLNSKKFIRWLSTLPWEQQYLMDNIIDANKWSQIFKNDPHSLEFAKICVTELNI